MQCPFKVATQVADELSDDSLHNLTVMSQLPVARRGAVGWNATELTQLGSQLQSQLRCPSRVATQVTDEYLKTWRRERMLFTISNGYLTPYMPLKQSSFLLSVAYKYPLINSCLSWKYILLSIGLNTVFAQDNLLRCGISWLNYLVVFREPYINAFSATKLLKSVFLRLCTAFEFIDIHNRICWWKYFTFIL